MDAFPTKAEIRLYEERSPCSFFLPHGFSSLYTVGDERALQLDDDALFEQIRAEMVQATGVQEHPNERIVTRWPQAIPQHETGHQAHMAEIETTLHAWPDLVLAGASYHGVGIASLYPG